MTEKVHEIARKMGAEAVEELPRRPGAGALGAYRLLDSLAHRLQPSQGARPGRPSVETWTVRRKVPMSKETENKLQRLAAQTSTADRKVSPMQVAAQLLEHAVDEFEGE